MWNWIAYLLFSATCFGIQDTLCDIIIGEHDEEEEEVQKTSSGNKVYEMVHQNPDNPKSDSEKAHVIVKQDNVLEELNGFQTIFVCVVFTYVVLMIYFSWIMWNHEEYYAFMKGESFLFRPHYDSKFAYAMVSGIFCYFHYHYTVKAFESTSSTVILPLLQFPSIFTFIFSSIFKIFHGKPWLQSYFHFLAYGILFLGGLLPATNGNFGTLMNRSFWRKPFVKYAILAEVSHGFYNICISTVEDDVKGIWSYMEYFAITRIFFIFTFVYLLVTSKKNQHDVWQMRYVATKQIYTTIVAEVCTLLGYFYSAMAYQAYYQVRDLIKIKKEKKYRYSIK